MAIMTDSKGNVFLEFIVLEEDRLDRTALDAPLTHALIVVECQGKYLFLFNKWRKSWEIPRAV